MTPLFDLRKQLEIYLFGALLLIAALYGVWRAYPLLAGPHVTITSPHDGDTVPSGTFIVTGQVSRVKNIEIQERPIPIDKDGNFSEVVVAHMPYTILTVKATDFYDKTVVKTMHVIPAK
jgi:hypothetical protein